ncbi:glycoside hydrolase family 5 protein [Massilibacteroides sp.]|uniref:glycoside hydrolase family 5 protein n=1 Tax=Massilibacteroides sp. TaxID=2034766 RepID=UPI002619A8E8|nr:glycoside hydrolase family 5 protein [Massilibacteroides sp.]MDD4514122.1 glycoside hydrolase family 5 protein [Massilibacteroides sp.]
MNINFTKNRAFFTLFLITLLFLFGRCSSDNENRVQEEKEEEENIETLPPDKQGMESDSQELAENIVLGWNAGNSLEVPLSNGGETGWGNPKISKDLITAVKKAGFNAIRIPCAWNSYLEEGSEYRIRTSWMERVKEVVDYCIENDMYVILNSHWDGGWLENNPTYSQQAIVVKKQKAIWKQIATAFNDYDERLLFAGTNEVHVSNVYTAPTKENNEVLQSYNQAFVDAVRETGGKNTYRHLIVQTYNTNIQFGIDYLTMPSDPTPNRLFVEVHYYDPYDFALNENSDIYFWGKPYSQYGKTDSWGQEDFLEEIFAKVKQQFTDKGYPVILGEYGAIRRLSLKENTQENHLKSRAYYLSKVTEIAKKNGLVPFYWDNGHAGDNGLALFNRSDATLVDKQAIDALLEGAK